MALYDTSPMDASRPYGRVVSTCVLAWLLIGTWRHVWFFESAQRIGLIKKPAWVDAQWVWVIVSGISWTDPALNAVQLQQELEDLKRQIWTRSDQEDQLPAIEEEFADQSWEQQPPVNTQPQVQNQQPSTQLNQQIIQTPSGTPIYSFGSLFGEWAEWVVESTIVPLSDTFQREGVLKSAVDVWVEDQIQYIQKTIYNDHFAYLGGFNQWLLPKVLQAGGAVVAYEDTQSILDEWLFWSRVWMIQWLEEWERKEKTLMIVFFDQARNWVWDAWYMQFDTEHYEEIKQELPTLFAQWYDW